MAFDLEVPGRDPRDLVRSFARSASVFGCSIKGEGKIPGSGWARTVSAVVARCDDGAIALEAVDNQMVRVSCPQPATRTQCEVLLGKISDASR
jgi:hypothetical protein